MSKSHIYRITVESLDAEEKGASQPLVFEVQDREDVFQVVETLKQKSGLDDTQATQLGVSLRLLGPMMVQHRKNPLFADFMPHFKTFMANLKKFLKQTA